MYLAGHADAFLHPSWSLIVQVNSGAFIDPGCSDGLQQSGMRQRVLLRGPLKAGMQTCFQVPQACRFPKPTVSAAWYNPQDLPGHSHCIARP